TAQDMLNFKLVDMVIPEPLGGAHRDATGMALTVRDALIPVVTSLVSMGITDLLEARYRRYRDLGPFTGSDL
ncbi:MAG: accA, partial [Chloroflexi bacterium]|nr:accA [Chloroflexota bacterium]